jgi:hypothetical protein
MKYLKTLMAVAAFALAIGSVKADRLDSAYLKELAADKAATEGCIGVGHSYSEFCKFFGAAGKDNGDGWVKWPDRHITATFDCYAEFQQNEAVAIRWHYPTPDGKDLNWLAFRSRPSFHWEDVITRSGGGNYQINRSFSLFTCVDERQQDLYIATIRWVEQYHPEWLADMVTENTQPPTE